MASFSFHLAIISMAFMSSSLLSSASHQPNNNTKIPILSSLSYIQEVSPDIAPLLPSPGDVSPTPTASDITTIPSSPSPPNPDDTEAPGPLSSFSPFGLLQASSDAPGRTVSCPGMAAFAGLAAYWCVKDRRM